MNAKTNLLMALIAASDLALFSSGAWAWQANIRGTANGGSAQAVAVDGAGNVVAAGNTENIGTFVDFSVVKFDGSSGAVLWQQDINGRATDSFDLALAVTVDRAGNVVAAGLTENTGTGQDFTVVKFDGSSGAVLWQRDIRGTANFSEADAVAVDGAGNVVAAGRTDNIGTGGDFTVIKFDGSTGAVLWQRDINGTANDLDGAQAVAVDSAGNVVAAGWTQNTGTGSDFTVVKLDGSTGAVLWQRDINGTANGLDEAQAVAVDTAGNVVAAGWTQNSTVPGSTDFTVIKFAGTTGAEIWRQVITGTARAGQVIAGIPNGFGRAEAVAVDVVGNVVAAGVTPNLHVYLFDDPIRRFLENRLDFTVVKFDGTSGAVLWPQVISGTAPTNSAPGAWDEAFAVGVDGAGNVVAAGRTFNTGTAQDFTVVKFDASSGAVLWQRDINGTANGFDGATAVAADGAGNVAAAGFTHNTGTPRADFTVVKLKGIDGTSFTGRPPYPPCPRGLPPDACF